MPDAAPLAPHVLSEMCTRIASGAENAFYVVDLDTVSSRVDKWFDLLPNVTPFYAVKCNPDVELLKTLASRGAGFDCASQAEMSLVLKDAGVDASRIIYANPCKQPSHLRYAVDEGVQLSVFDSEEELLKTAAISAGSAEPHEVVLRIQVDDSKAQCVMSNKYGAPMAEVPFLLRRARELGLRVRGVSFHVGSGCYSAQAFPDAVRRAAHVHDLAAAAGAPMDLLDIGGGFPGVDTEDLSFGQIAAALRPALAELFPPSRGVALIAEPGRYVAAASSTLAVNIIGKKVLADPSAAGGARTMYYVNDGLYGSFNCIVYDHAAPSAEPLPLAAARGLAAFPWSAAAPHRYLAAGGAPASVWGPTCDGMDCVVQDTTLPDLAVGDWLYFRNMGAYTAAAGSNFNGMALPDRVYLHGEHAPPLEQRAAAAAACVAIVSEMCAVGAAAPKSMLRLAR